MTDDYGIKSSQRARVIGMMTRQDDLACPICSLQDKEIQ